MSGIPVLFLTWYMVYFCLFLKVWQNRKRKNNLIRSNKSDSLSIIMYLCIPDSAMQIMLVQSAGAVEYTDCTSAEG